MGALNSAAINAGAINGSADASEDVPTFLAIRFSAETYTASVLSNETYP